MKDCDLDHIAFASGDSRKVMLSGRALPYRHGIVQVHHMPGDVFQITIRRDAITEAAKMRRSFIGRLFERLFPIDEIAP